MSSPKLFFRFFHMTGCGPCGIVAPIIDQVESEFINEPLVQFSRHNVSDDNWAMATKLGVNSTPTVKLYADDFELEFAEGPLPKSAYVQMLSRQIESLDSTLMLIDKAKANLSQK